MKSWFQTVDWRRQPVEPDSAQARRAAARASRQHAGRSGVQPDRPCADDTSDDCTSCGCADDSASERTNGPAGPLEREVHACIQAMHRRVQRVPFQVEHPVVDAGPDRAEQ